MKAAGHWAQIGESTCVWGMRLLFGVFRYGGRPLLQAFLYPVVSYYWLSHPNARQASRQFWRRLAVFNGERPEHLNWRSWRHFIAFANAIIDKMAAWADALPADAVEFEGRERLLADLGRGRGALLLACHLGNPEVCRVMARRDPNVKINVLVHTKHAERFNRLLARYNPASALNLLQVTEIDAGVAMRLAEKIEQGELVVIAADRTPVGGGRIAWADFLGASAPLPQGPFVLAGLLRCPVYGLFCIKQAGRHRIIFEPFSDGLTWTRANRDAVIHAAVRRYAERLQHHCLTAPRQWFNFYDFWRVQKC
ncbi:hypothetical protein ACQE3E_14320 [Methylomonas sp. MED-D]|uniref:LpxL/LpxP family acyltransferase n=1 Tax=unclassified Methylomonas TaxID=2608980 RepID=UPI00143B04C5|nr:hypothetical protein [Methylomonas sp. MV1]MDT4331404.1 hypothetical protein [Methylomonas sp. MV1]NJA05398.1 hypothetical protein [Methylococcaceae bacterium WWC4]